MAVFILDTDLTLEVIDWVADERPEPDAALATKFVDILLAMDDTTLIQSVHFLQSTAQFPMEALDQDPRWPPFVEQKKAQFAAEAEQSEV